MSSVIHSNIYKELVSAQPWIAYNASQAFGNKSVSETESLKKEMLAFQPVVELLAEIENWPGHTMRNHRDASHLLHKLSFLASIGIRASDLHSYTFIEKIMESVSAEGPPNISINIPKSFGGTGTDIRSWIICDAAVLLDALVSMGLKEHEVVKNGISYLINNAQDFGWSCTSSGNIGKFRGPGRKSDPCPYANLLMLRLLAKLPEYHDTDFVFSGLNSLFNLWENRKVKKPYLFGIGTDFLKLKVPFVWYDILHMLEVISHYSKTGFRKEIAEIADSVFSKADSEGFYKAESIYRSWSSWDFGQKKESSLWVTFLVYRIKNRLSDV